MKRVLITRPTAQAASFAAELTCAGFQPVFFPVIEIQPMDDTGAIDRALESLESYQWVVFTSANGVSTVWDRLEALGKAGLPASLKVAAIGPKTAAALEKRDVKPDFVPDEYIAEAVMPGLGDLDGCWVLLPRAEIARKALPEAIRRAGGTAHEISVYRTLPAKVDPAGLQALRQGVDVITFTSPSTVHNFLEILKNEGLEMSSLPGKPLIACIGPITASAAREQGLKIDIVAAEYTSEGLVQALRKKVSNENQSS